MLDAPDDTCELNALPVGVIVHLNGTIERVNALAAEILGTEVARAVGQHVNTYLSPREAARLRERYERRLRGETVPTTYECTVIRADGRHRRLEVNVGLRGERAFITLRDITERTLERDRRLALAHLGAALHQHRSEEAVLQALRGGIADIGLGCALFEASSSRPGLVFLDISPVLRDVLTKALGANFASRHGRWSPGLEDALRWGESYVDDVPEEVAELAGTQAAALLRAKGLDVPPHAILARLDRVGGGRSVLAVFGEWIREDDLPVIRLLASQLTTALDNVVALGEAQRKERQAEAVNRLARELLEAASESAPRVLDVASAHIAAAVSARHAEVLLLDSAGEALYASEARDDVPLSSAPIARQVLEHAAPAAIVDTSIDHRAGRLDREERSMAVLLVPLASSRGPRGLITISDEAGRRFRDDETALALAMGSVVDVALENAALHLEARQRVVELSQTQAQLVEQERLAALGELAAVMAHEVRNPLGVIFNSLGSLRRLIPPSEDAETLLGILREEADRLNRIVGDLLDFARPMNIVREPVDIESFCEAAVQAACTIDPHGSELERVLDVPPSLHPVALDARLLRQALLNLCVNAMQAMTGGGRLGLRVTLEGRDLCIDVSDTGPGIAEGVRARIFEPFFTTKATGTGLGLAVVRRIVEAHGGALWVECPDGGGTTFSMRLPLPEPSAERASSPALQ